MYNTWLIARFLVTRNLCQWFGVEEKVPPWPEFHIANNNECAYIFFFSCLHSHLYEGQSNGKLNGIFSVEEAADGKKKTKIFTVR